MAQLGVAKKGDVLKTTVGSCIAIILHDAKAKQYGMAHIMLPKKNAGLISNPAKFADSAIPELIKKMRIDRDQVYHLKAKIAGGANMFKGRVTSPMLKIGDQNIQAVKTVLNDFKIKLIAEDVGGDKGRQITITTDENKIEVAKIGEKPIEL